MKVLVNYLEVCVGSMVLESFHTILMPCRLEQPLKCQNGLRLAFQPKEQLYNFLGGGLKANPIETPLWCWSGVTNY